MEYTNRLYMMLYPNNFLVGSQLTPEELGRHYLTGSKQYYSGKLIFAEVDVNYRNPYLDIEWGLDQLVPHEDGRPKSTKFISSYRVLEHIDFQAIKNIYITSAAGYVMKLDSAEYNEPSSNRDLRIYAGISPLRMLAMSQYSFQEYGKFITKPRNPKGAPQFFYTQLEFDGPEFEHEFKDNPFMPETVPGVHPQILKRAMDEIRTYREKSSKGLRLDSQFHEFPMKLIRHGFMFASTEGMKYFPMPSLEDIQDKYYKFYQTM